MRLSRREKPNPRCLDISLRALSGQNDDITVAYPILDDRIRFEHEPLRPVARLILLSKDTEGIFLDGFIMFQRQAGTRPALADVAGSQAAPVYCSSPCGTVRWIMALWRAKGSAR